MCVCICLCIKDRQRRRTSVRLWIQKTFFRMLGIFKLYDWHSFLSYVEPAMSRGQGSLVRFQVFTALDLHISTSPCQSKIWVDEGGSRLSAGPRQVNYREGRVAPGPAHTQKPVISDPCSWSTKPYLGTRFLEFDWQSARRRHRHLQ